MHFPTVPTSDNENILFFLREVPVTCRCPRKEDYTKESLAREEGHKISMAYLHHREVTPEEVLELHKLLQTGPVLRHSLPQLRPALQQGLDLGPQHVHPLWARLFQPRSLTLHLLYLLPDGFKVVLWRDTLQISHVAHLNRMQIVPLYNYDLILMIQQRCHMI